MGSNFKNFLHNLDFLGEFDHYLFISNMLAKGVTFKVFFVHLSSQWIFTASGVRKKVVAGKSTFLLKLQMLSSYVFHCRGYPKASPVYYLLTCT